MHRCPPEVSNRAQWISVRGWDVAWLDGGCEGNANCTRYLRVGMPHDIITSIYLTPYYSITAQRDHGVLRMEYTLTGLSNHHKYYELCRPVQYDFKKPCSEGVKGKVP